MIEKPRSSQARSASQDVKTQYRTSLPWLAGCALSVSVFLAACEQEQVDGSKSADEHAPDSMEAYTMSNPDISTGFVGSNGAKLFYQRAGTGPVIVLVHGSAGNSDLWENQIPAFTQAGYQVVAFDLRSAGRSEPGPGQQAAGTIADDIEAIRTELGLDDLFVVGQAQGAEGALEYSLKYADHVRGIVVAATYRGADSDPAFVELRDRLAPPSNFAGRSGLQMRLSAHYIENNQDGVDRFVEIAEFNKNRRSVKAQLDGKKLAAAIQSVGMPLDYKLLSKINVPALVLSAERDDITPPALMAELAKNIPNARYETVPNAGRYAFWENPEEFNKIALSFFDATLSASKLDNVAPGHYLEVSDCRIWYRDTGGTGEPVLFFHPFTGTDDVWKNQFAPLADKGFRVVAFARRGAGCSGDLPIAGDPSTEDAEALLDQLKIQNVHLVGSAAGGIEALKFAVKNPQRVQSLVLSNSLAGASAVEIIELQKQSPTTGLAPEEKELSASFISSDPQSVADWLAIESQSLAAKFAALSDEDRKARTGALLGSFPDTEEIEALTIPVLLVYGGADLYLPESLTQTIQNRFQNPEFVTVPDAAHAAHWETPEEFNEALIGFWRRTM